MHVCIEILLIIFKSMYLYLIKIEVCFTRCNEKKNCKHKDKCFPKKAGNVKTIMYSQNTTVNIIEIDLQREGERLDRLISLIVSLYSSY